LEALDGILVVDFTQLIAGPSAAMMLAQMGAEVVKLEPPQGDIGRGLGATTRNGGSPTFRMYNHFKRFATANLKNPEDAGAVERLLARADVVLENFRPGVMSRLGFDYPAVRKLNDRVVYCSLTGFPKTDGDSRGAVDIVIQAESGIMDLTGAAGGPPTKVGFTIVDAATAHVIVHAILAALFARERGNGGSNIEVSLFEVAIHLEAAPIAEYLATGVRPIRSGNSAPLSAPADLFPTLDGDIMISTYTPSHWEGLCVALNRPDVFANQRFDSVQKRVSNRDELWATLAETFRLRTTQDWLSALHRKGLAVGRVRRLSDVAEEARDTPGGMLYGDEHDPVMRLPYTASDAPISSPLLSTSTMAIGSDNDEVFGRSSGGGA
jgi:crotonobetainyl-CoA:carnitine CoA-transferase CaiB-like acyl-CoA transferase